MQTLLQSQHILLITESLFLNHKFSRQFNAGCSSCIIVCFNKDW